MKGWGPKSSACPSKPGKSDFWGGISRDFAGISRRFPEKFEKIKRVQVLAPDLRICFIYFSKSGGEEESEAGWRGFAFIEGRGD